ncbi:MAG: class I SAM-dependent methyltransferase, partial [Pseudomonadota bacterium]
AIMTDAKFWDAAARKYARSKISDMPAYEETIRRARAHLSPNDRVLELGCGTGTTALRLADAVASYTATDVSSEMIAIGNEKLAVDPVPGLQFSVSSADGAGVGARDFDVVMGFNLFHLVADPDAAFRQVHTLLRDGGLLISKTPCLSRRWYLRPLVGAMKPVGKAPRHVHFFSVDGYDDVIVRAGFEIVETGLYPPGVPSRFVVARKVGG